MANIQNPNLSTQKLYEDLERMTTAKEQYFKKISD